MGWKGKRGWLSNLVASSKAQMEAWRLRRVRKTRRGKEPKTSQR